MRCRFRSRLHAVTTHSAHRVSESTGTTRHTNSKRRHCLGQSPHRGFSAAPPVNLGYQNMDVSLMEFKLVGIWITEAIGAPPLKTRELIAFWKEVAERVIQVLQALREEWAAHPPTTAHRTTCTIGTQTMSWQCWHSFHAIKLTSCPRRIGTYQRSDAGASLIDVEREFESDGLESLHGSTVLHRAR